MRVTLDGTQLDLDTPTLGSALSAAVARAEGAGRMVVAADADGLPVPDALLEDPSSDPGWTCAELSFQSEDPAALVRRSFLDARDAIAQAEADQDDAIEQSRLGNPDAAVEAVRAAMEKWQAVQDVVLQGSQLVNLDLETIAFVDAQGQRNTVHDAIEHLAKALAALAQGVGDDDWVTAADVLDAELRTEVSRWSSLLDALAEAVGS